MAANKLYITPDYDKSRVCLQGNMEVAFNQAVDSSFSVRLFTITNEFFTISSNFATFTGIGNAPVSQFSFGGRPGLYVEFMYDSIANTWYMVANNIVATSSGSTGVGELVFDDSKTVTSTSLDSKLGNVFVIKLTADFALPKVTNPEPGKTYLMIFAQDIAGGHTLTLDKSYRFTYNVAPVQNFEGSIIDILEATYSSSGFYYCTYRSGYSTSNIARITSTQYETMALAGAAAKDGDTIYITRSGQMAECLVPLTQNIRLTVAGDPALTGVPKLTVDGTIRLAWGKGIINVEAGDVTIRDAKFTGAVNPEQSGAGIRNNPGTRNLRLERVTVSNNNNGVITGNLLPENYVVGDGYSMEIIDCLFDKNGTASGTQLGQSHNIYLSHDHHVYVLRSKFTNSVNGHDFKTRAALVVLDRVYCRGAGSRELDVPDGGIIHAVNCSFVMDPKSGQNNLVGLTHESTSNPQHEFIFRNCLFQNLSGGNFSETYVHQLLGNFPVKFIDCVFIGPEKCVIASPFELYYTGGPIGPEGWDQSNRGVFPPKGGTYNPNVGNSPWPDAQQPTIVYGPDPTLSAFPSTGSTSTPSVRPENSGPDVTPPTVTLTSSKTTVSTSGSITLTATAADNIGVSRVDFYRDNVLIFNDTASPYSVDVPLTEADVGTIAFTAKAYDIAGNFTTSNPVSVLVNILPPTQNYPLSIDGVTASEYNTAVTNAALGTKRLAGANAIANAMQPYRLYIYQESTLVLSYDFVDKLSVTEDGVNVYVRSGTPEASDPLISADINGGTWHFELQGSPDYSRVIKGSVGPVGSGKMIELIDSPAPGTGCG